VRDPKGACTQAWLSRDPRRQQPRPARTNVDRGEARRACGTARTPARSAPIRRGTTVAGDGGCPVGPPTRPAWRGRQRAVRGSRPPTSPARVAACGRGASRMLPTLTFSRSQAWVTRMPSMSSTRERTSAVSPVTSTDSTWTTGRARSRQVALLVPESGGGGPPVRQPRSPLPSARRRVRCHGHQRWRERRAR
jgi:hypothetical protein